MTNNNIKTLRSRIEKMSSEEFKVYWENRAENWGNRVNEIYNELSSEDKKALNKISRKFYKGETLKNMVEKMVEQGDFTTKELPIYEKTESLYDVKIIGYDYKILGGDRTSQKVNEIVVKYFEQLSEERVNTNIAENEYVDNQNRIHAEKHTLTEKQNEKLDKCINDYEENGYKNYGVSKKVSKINISISSEGKMYLDIITIDNNKYTEVFAQDGSFIKDSIHDNTVNSSKTIFIKTIHVK